MGEIDVDPPRPPRSHAGKPTPRTTRSAVSPSGATDGHPRWFGGSSKSLQPRSMSARVDGLGSLTESTEDTEGRARFGMIDISPPCPPRLHDGSDRRGSSMSFPTSRWSARLGPSMSFPTSRWSARRQPSVSLGCPSVARRRSRRRQRNVGREPSMEVIDVDHRCRPDITME
jgi:hypothetical protein